MWAWILPGQLSFQGREWLVSRQPKNPRDGIFSREENSDALSPALAGRAPKKNQCPCSRFELFFSPRLQKRVVSLN